MNIILSIVLVAGLYMHGSKQPAYLDKPMVLAGVLPDSTAQKAGLAAGDHVVKDQRCRAIPRGIGRSLELMSTLPGHSLSLVVDRGRTRTSRSLVPAGQSLEDIFGYPADRLLIGAVSAGNAGRAKRVEERATRS